MPRKVFINERALGVIHDAVGDADEYVIGGEKNSPVGARYYHVKNESASKPNSDSADAIRDLCIEVIASIGTDGVTWGDILYSVEENKVYLVADTSDVMEDEGYITQYLTDEARRYLDSNGLDGMGIEVVDEVPYIEDGHLIDLDENMALASGRLIHEAFEAINEEVVADGNSEHNPYAKKWKAERQALKDFVVKYGKLMTSKENGRTYKVYFDDTMSELIGYNYCICLLYDQTTMKEGSTLYIRALDMFTDRMFDADFDTRGRDNMQGTYDDLS